MDPLYDWRDGMGNTYKSKLYREEEEKLWKQLNTPAWPVSPAPTEGRKDDQGKLKWSLIPLDALEEVAKVYTVGANKYEPYNWAKGIAYSRMADAFMRHWKAWWEDREERHEGGMHHLASCVFYLLAFMRYEKTRREFDDRPKEEEKK